MSNFRRKTLRSVDKFGCKSSVSAMSLLYKNFKEYIRADFLRCNKIKVHMAVKDCKAGKQKYDFNNFKFFTSNFFFHTQLCFRTLTFYDDKLFPKNCRREILELVQLVFSQSKAP